MGETEDYPLHAIKRHCLECSGGSAHYRLWCTVTACHLWRFRFGVRPSSLAKRGRGLLVNPQAQPGPNVILDTLPKLIPAAIEYLKRRMGTPAPEQMGSQIHPKT